MILMFIGATVGLFGFCFIPDGNYAVIIIGAMLLMLGVTVSNKHTAKTLAERNVREYWAYGKKPDWMEKQREQEETAERADRAIRPFHAFLWAVLICVVLFALIVDLSV